MLLLGRKSTIFDMLLSIHNERIDLERLGAVRAGDLLATHVVVDGETLAAPGTEGRQAVVPMAGGGGAEKKTRDAS